MTSKSFQLTKTDQQSIVAAIREAELNTSGEIRVHIDKKCPDDVLEKATYWFEKLKMHRTELRNGVLFYLALEDRKFAILGDVGINAKVPADFWDGIRNQMLEMFKSGQMVDGLVAGIRESGNQLKVHFPYQSNDVNELPDEISFGK